MPSETISGAPSDVPSLEPSSSSHPTEVYRPSSSPTVTSVPSSGPSSIPSNLPSSQPSIQPSKYAGEPTNSIGSLDTVVSTFGCSSNSNVNMIFDGTTNEYVCEGGDNSNSTRMLVEQGFVISPNLTNPSIVEKLRVYADSSCSECDPVEFVLEGTSDQNLDDDIEWKLISNGELPWVDDEDPARNGEDISILASTYAHGDEALSFTEVTFNNSDAFVHYRLSFPRTRDDDFNLVVAEVELPGREFEEIPTNPPSSKPTRRTRRPTPVSATSKPTISVTTKPTKKPRSPRPSPKTPRPHKQRTRKPTRIARSRRPTPRPTKSKGNGNPTPKPQRGRTPKPNRRPAPRPIPEREPGSRFD